MKPVPGPVSAALANGFPPLGRAELYDVVLVDGTEFHWTTWEVNLSYDGNTYTSYNPFMRRSGWKVTNTMSVPEMTLTLLSTLDAFNGGAALRAQITQGLLDGAKVTLTYAFYDTSLLPDYDAGFLGVIVMFGGVVSTAKIAGAAAVITVKGANNLLDQSAPRRVFQVQCNNTFCDAGCTLDRADFTDAYVVGASPTRTFIPWDTPPANPEYYIFGTVTMTSGPASGQSMNVDFADSSGLTLVFPLYNAPDPGDTFDAFEGCDKTQTTCERRTNEQNGLWFPFIPPAETAF